MLDVCEERVDEVAGVALFGERAAVEVAYGPAEDTGYDDGGDEAEGVCCGGDEEGEHVIPVEDVADEDVYRSQTGLITVALAGYSMAHNRQKRRNINSQQLVCQPGQTG